MISLAPLAQRRHANLDDLEPVVEVFAELARRGSSASRSRLVAAMTRTSTAIGRLLPSSRELAILQHVEQLGLQERGISPISSSMIVPRLANSNLPTRDDCAPVKAPRSCPNSSLSSSSDGRAAQLTFTKPCRAAAGAPVQLARDDFLADAALAA